MRDGVIRRASTAGGWWLTDMTWLIAWRALVHDRVRFLVTLVGIVFSVVLMGMQLGLLLNFVTTTQGLVARAGADIWIMARGVKSADIATPFDERWRFQALATEGVVAAEGYSVDFAFWKRPDGVRESTILIGVDLDATMGLPTPMVDGADARAALAAPDGVIVDRLFLAKLGVTGAGQILEINDRRVRIAGFTQGVRTFTQSPYVYTSRENARAIAGRGPRHLNYVLIRAAPGVELETLRQRLAERMPEVDVRLARRFAADSASYWLFSTGAGVSLIMSGVLGLLVGGAIAAQTLYANTMDRLPQYATLRAMGCASGYLHRIVLAQGAIAGAIGYAIGIAVVIAIARASENASAGPEMPAWLALAIGAMTLATCLVAAVASLVKVTRIDPVKVFR
jgi:putative ABC transport system permease protein